MLIRLALILAFVVPQFALSALLSNWMPAECEATSCCRVVEQETCCGDEVVEIQCGETGNTCLCGLEPDGSETPIPTLPTRDSTVPALALLPRAATIAMERLDAARVTRPGTVERPFRSHNSQQALLGVWRT
jgi:hypothetical protein